MADADVPCRRCLRPPGPPCCSSSHGPCCCCSVRTPSLLCLAASYAAVRPWWFVRNHWPWFSIVSHCPALRIIFLRTPLSEPVVFVVLLRISGLAVLMSGSMRGWSFTCPIRSVRTRSSPASAAAAPGLCPRCADVGEHEGLVTSPSTPSAHVVARFRSAVVVRNHWPWFSVVRHRPVLRIVLLRLPPIEPVFLYAFCEHLMGGVRPRRACGRFRFSC
jgi:hypothetical protein